MHEVTQLCILWFLFVIGMNTTLGQPPDDNKKLLVVFTLIAALFTAIIRILVY